MPMGRDRRSASRNQARPSAYNFIMNQRDLAQYITAAVVNYWRFKRQMSGVATEVGYYASDVLAYNDKGQVFETEVKVSKSDFKREFKKIKHDSKDNTAPTKFYFAVPEAMSKWAKEYLDEKKSGWGLIKVGDWNGNGPCVENVKIVKNSKKLETTKAQVEQAKKMIVRRASSQLASLLEDRVRRKMGKTKCLECKGHGMVKASAEERERYKFWTSCPSCRGVGYIDTV